MCKSLNFKFQTSPTHLGDGVPLVTSSALSHPGLGTRSVTAPKFGSASKSASVFKRTPDSIRENKRDKI